MKNVAKEWKGKSSQIKFLLSIILGVTIFGDLLSNYDNLNKESKNNIQQISLSPSVQASVLNTSSVSNNTPIGSNITTEDILELASLFNDQPFQG